VAVDVAVFDLSPVCATLAVQPPGETDDMDRQAYLDKIKAQMEIWNAQIDQMQAEAKKAEADMRIRYEEQIKEMRQRRDEAEEKMVEARTASEKAWDDMSKGFADAWKMIHQGFENASKRYK
jgi:predicted  nucleic acid-binding Zn-ribbon protein